MTARLTLDPASAVAAGRCLLARTRGPIAVTNNHPRPCAWEDWGTDALTAMLDDFNHEAEFDARWDRYRHPDVERFRALPAPEQSRRVAAAQYPEDRP